MGTRAALLANCALDFQNHRIGRDFSAIALRVSSWANPSPSWRRPELQKDGVCIYVQIIGGPHAPDSRDDRSMPLVITWDCLLQANDSKAKKGVVAYVKSQLWRASRSAKFVRRRVLRDSP